MKKYTIYILLAIFVIIISCDGDGNGTQPTVNLEMGMEPSTQTIAVGDSAIFAVTIKDANDLFAISVEIVFDSTLTSVSDVANSVIFGSLWPANIHGWFFSESGILSVAIGFEGTGSINGDGTLFTFELNGDATGSSNITFQNLSLIDENGNQIDGFDDIVFENGQLIIQ